MLYIVLESRNTDYPEPIVLQKGDIVRLGEVYTGDEWENWIWAVKDNLKGWVPLQIIARQNDSFACVTEDYTARELNVVAGNTFFSEKKMNGWHYGYLLQDPHEKGWVPDNILNELKETHIEG